VRHRILALAILCALALQLELPVAHAPAHASTQGTSVALAHGAQPLSLTPASVSHPSAHDPASCPICQSLHAKPAAAPTALPQHWPSVREVAVAAPEQRPHDCSAQTGHPPRAPPLAAHTLA
jgi:hypothetical protein